MENQVIDQLHEDIEPQRNVYAGFWQRVGAVVIDTIILAPITWGLTYYVLIYVKSLLLSLSLTLALPIYKCYMEKKYGATFGKKIVNIYVVSENMQALTYKEVFIRNYYYFISLIMVFSGYYFMYEMPDFQAATTLSQVLTIKSESTTIQKIVRYAIIVLFYIDNLLMLKNSRNQTLHDRLGKTVVLNK